jgi:hypothetical protein
MKKIISLFVFISLISFSVAQVQRKINAENKPDSVMNNSDKKQGQFANKKKLMKDLDLSKEQKSKLKEQRQIAQEKKAAIEGNEKLTPAQQEAKLKELRKEQAKNTLDILNEEQKEQLKKMRKDKKASKTEGTENQ